MNAGSFKKGEKRPNQGKRGPGKMTLKGREALTAIIEGNIPKVQTWLDTIEREDGAKAALDGFAKLLEFAIPKQARHELSSYQAAEVIVRLAGEYQPQIHNLGEAVPDQDASPGESNTVVITKWE
jgi:hypothetical protein